MKLEKYEDENMGEFRRIYPPPKSVEDKYAKYFNNLSSLFQTTAAQKAREQASRLVHIILFFIFPTKVLESLFY